MTTETPDLLEASDPTDASTAPPNPLAVLKAQLPDLMSRPLSLAAFGRESAKQSARILKGEDLPLPMVEILLSGGTTLIGTIRAIQEATDPSMQFETDTGRLYQIRIEAIQAATVVRLATPDERAAFIAG